MEGSIICLQPHEMAGEGGEGGEKGWKLWGEGKMWKERKLDLHATWTETPKHADPVNTGCPKKKLLTECCWSRSAAAESPVADTPCYWQSHPLLEQGWAGMTFKSSGTEWELPLTPVLEIVFLVVSTKTTKSCPYYFLKKIWPRGTQIWLGFLRQPVCWCYFFSSRLDFVWEKNNKLWHGHWTLLLVT